MFEQELYNSFSIYVPKPYFITFAGDVSFTRYSFLFLFMVLCFLHQNSNLGIDEYFLLLCFYLFKKMQLERAMVLSEPFSQGVSLFLQPNKELLSAIWKRVDYLKRI